jgi:hypothetical protein
VDETAWISGPRGPGFKSRAPDQPERSFASDLGLQATPVAYVLQTVRNRGLSYSFTWHETNGGCAGNIGVADMDTPSV